jgi:4-hydroxy-2-oxoglutarate aldolase
VNIELSGIYPPVPTPFLADESIAFERFEQNLGWWARQPIDGIVMPGSNSEAVFLSHAERVRIWQVCADVLRGTGKCLIAGTGAESTSETIALTQQAAELGAVAALVLPPTFYKPALSGHVLVNHYYTIAEATSLPLLVYNVPVFTGIDFALDTILALAEHPRIVGMKDSSANVVKTAGVLAARPDFQVFAGTGSALLPFLSIGGVGTISALANIAAGPLCRVLELFQAGQQQEARQVQLSLVQLNQAITARFGVPGLKYAMDRLGLYGGPPRRPLLPASEDARAEIDRLLVETPGLQPARD